MAIVEDLRVRGEIGGRTVQIVSSGAVECAHYEPASLPSGSVRVATVRSAISSGTEMTFYGRDASNIYLHKRWNETLRLFEAGEPSMEYPITLGYRAAGVVVDSGDTDVELGTRVYGNWRHTEFISMPADRARAQTVPAELTWDDAVDIAQMGPICVNAVAFGEGAHREGVSVVFGAGPVGLMAAQIAAAEGAEVHVVDRIPERLAIARELGLQTFAADGADVAAAIKRRYGANGIGVAWECSGSTYALHEAIRVVRQQGTVVAVGFYQGEGAGLLLGDEFHHNGVRIVCGQIGNLHPSTTWDALRQRTMELARTGAVHFGRLPRLTLPVERADEAFLALTRPAEALQAALEFPIAAELGTSATAG